MQKPRIRGELGRGEVLVGSDKPDPEPEAKAKKERKPVIRNGLFYLYKRDGELSTVLTEIGSYYTKVEIQEDYKIALEKGILPDQLKGFIARELIFNVKPAEMKITVK